MESPMPTDNQSNVSALNGALINGLKANGYICTPEVEAAFHAVPRHLFVPDVSLEKAYSDRSIPTKHLDGQLVSSCSQPSMVAIMLEQLGLEPGHKVLEIGAGTGYNAALMAHIVGKEGQVITVDIDDDIVAHAGEHLAAAGSNRVQVVCADGGYGYIDAAPYDRIILTVGASDICPAWWEQLKSHGRLVLPLEIKDSQMSIAFEQAEGYLESVSARGCRFMTLRGNFAASPVKRVQLGSEPGLFLEIRDERSIDGEAVHGWLTGIHKDWSTGIEVMLQEIMGRLRSWLALHEPSLGSLTATGDMVDGELVPPLLGLGGEWKSVSTIVLAGESGLATLMRPPGQPAPLADINELYAGETPFTLFVRQFGSDETLSQRLIELVNTWDDAGRPSNEELRIRAYPKDADYANSEGEFVYERQWTRFVLDW
jgi:protein-L-isoaspartate(D-aspartate) O-methyltransferase